MEAKRALLTALLHRAEPHIAWLDYKYSLYWGAQVEEIPDLKQFLHAIFPEAGQLDRLAIGLMMISESQCQRMSNRWNIAEENIHTILQQIILKVSVSTTKEIYYNFHILQPEGYEYEISGQAIALALYESGFKVEAPRVILSTKGLAFIEPFRKRRRQFIRITELKDTFIQKSISTPQTPPLEFELVTPREVRSIITETYRIPEE